jgi:hypothetical protein
VRNRVSEGAFKRFGCAIASLFFGYSEEKWLIS